MLAELLRGAVRFVEFRNESSEELYTATTRILKMPEKITDFREDMRSGDYGLKLI
jgi:hypothetical protein